MATTTTTGTNESRRESKLLVDAITHSARDDFSREEWSILKRLRDRLRLPGARVIVPDRLVSTQAAADLLGIEKSTVIRWRKSGYMPPPLATVGGRIGPVWLADDLEAFKKLHEEGADSAGRRPWGSGRDEAPVEE